jgi:multidrug resistance protein
MIWHGDVYASETHIARYRRPSSLNRIGNGSIGYRLGKGLRFWKCLPPLSKSLFQPLLLLSFVAVCSLQPRCSHLSDCWINTISRIRVRGPAMSTYENAVANASQKEKEKSDAVLDVEDDRSSASSISRDALSLEEIHQTLSRNAGLDGHEKSLAHITTVTTNMTTDPRFEVDFDEGENPQDWSLPKKCVTIFFMSFSTLVVVMYSTSYTAGIPGMMDTFHVENKTNLVLGLTTYLAGLALGSLILAPLSEMYGRRPVYLIAVAMFTVLIIPCALAQNLATILAVRFFVAFAGAAMISNAPGTVSDIVGTEYLALAFSIWSVGPMNGPVIGPLIGGFVFQYMGWRWTNWVVIIGSGLSWFMVFCVLLDAKASHQTDSL